MPGLSDATRPIMWNINGAWLMYLLFVIAMVVFSYGLYKRIMVWKSHKPDGERLGDWGERFWLLVKEIVFQRRVMNMSFPGIFHSFLFYSFVVFVITTAIVAIDYDFGTSFFNGWIYVIFTVGCEIGGLIFLVGLGMAVWRRYVVKPKELPTVGMDTWALVLLFLLILTGFLTEGVRLAVKPDPWYLLSFAGYGFSFLFRWADPETGSVIHKIIWWAHTFIGMAWIATIPYTKFTHLLFLPTNVFFSKLKPRGEWKRENIMEMMEDEDFDEETFQVGLQKTTELTWKQALDLDACINCGRCEVLCPSTRAGEPFGPRQFVQNCLTLSEEVRAAQEKAQAEGKKLEQDDIKDIVGSAFDEEFLWFCRTCGACMEICPACIDHVDDMIELKRNEILMQGRAPSEGQRVLRTMENLGNPFAAQADRNDWVKDELGAKIVKAGEEVEVLYFVGCLQTFDVQKQKIAKDLCELLTRCGVDFGVLGPGERCCGDPARLLGQEMQFQEAAMTQVEELNNRKFKILLTACPHCYNVLKHEYPQFDGKYNVMHHTEYLAELMSSGRLKPEVSNAFKATFHDPCYLGRYQDQYEAPRQVMAKLPGVSNTEMVDKKSKSLCCGGGGGHFWMDLKGGDARVNNMRVEQAKEAGAQVIATGCGFCMGMLDDAVKTLNLEDDLKVKDIATLLLETLPAPPKAEEPAPAPEAE